MVGLVGTGGPSPRRTGRDRRLTAMGLSGSVVVESIFAWPGMGRLFWEEAQRTDIPVVMAVLMFTSVLVIVFNLLADIAYAYLDPKIRYR